MDQNKKHKKAYIYPPTSRDDKMGLFNPYVEDFVGSLSTQFEFVNEGKGSNKGILDILKYIFKLDVIFFHWIEKLPVHRFGKIQAILFYFLLRIFQLFRVKIIWVMHNKMSHSGERLAWTRWIFKQMLKKANTIFTHSSEGIKYGESLVAGSGKKIHFFPHPVKDRRLEKRSDKEIDILIWGTVSPYKGIDKFLEFLAKRDLLENYKILIVGKSTDRAYSAELLKYLSDKIIIRNEFIEDSLLQEMIASSSVVLFTYAKASILSSGVLMDSLGYGASIVGPHIGGFADLANEHIISTFTDYDELIMILDEELTSHHSGRKDLLDKFLIENSWKAFSEKVKHILT